jgi:type II secretory pathway pseudopilin PulG
MKRITAKVTGYLLVEMMIILGLLGVATVLAFQLFRQSSRATLEASNQQAKQMRFDQAMQQLRADVWTASNLKTASAHDLQIETADGHITEWRYDGALRRGQPVKATDPARHWDDLGFTLSFRVIGPTAVVRIEPEPGEFGGDVVLPSQTMLLTSREAR